MLTTKDLSPLIGSQLIIDADTLLAGTHADEIRQLLVKRGVVLIRGLNLSDDQLRTLTSTIGKVREGAMHEEKGMLKVFHIPGAQFHLSHNFLSVHLGFICTLQVLKIKLSLLIANSRMLSRNG